MRGQVKWGRAGWLGGLAGLVAAIIAWQGVQAWSMGTVGVPGVLLLPISDQAGFSADDDEAFAGGVTVVAKTRRGAAKQMAPALRPAVAQQPVAPAVVEADQQATGSIPVPSSSPSPLAAAQLLPAPEQEAAAVPVSAPAPKARSAAAAPAHVPEPRLPWLTKSSPDAGRAAAALPQQPSPEPVALPSESDIRGWLRAEAEEFVGGVDEQGMPLYRFNVWLDAPAATHQRIMSVAYNFDAPSAKPKAQESRDQGNGFRVKFGGASCARTVVVTVTLDDGRSQVAEVDGCAILN